LGCLEPSNNQFGYSLVMPDQRPVTTCDVTVIGGGLAGKAASLHLAKAGLQTICIDPGDAARQPVGESLDWSTPELLGNLGLPLDNILAERVGTLKRRVVVKSRQGQTEEYFPFSWLSRPPFNLEIRTLHVDRTRMDEELRQKVADSGVSVVHDKVVRVEHNDKHISAVHTATGQQFSSPWFIDASGFATSLLAREFQLRALDYGDAKVALWAYFPVSDPIEGTTLYVEPDSRDYLDWIWEIPISAGVVSVGYIATGAAVKARREQGLTVKDIFRQQLIKFPRLESLLAASTLDDVNVTSFRSRVHLGAAGPNWLIAGEAACMVDPITANGVTAALRHAQESSDLILKYRKRRKLPPRARISYSARVAQLACFFNSGVENLVYQPPVRTHLGMAAAAAAYISPAWGMNVLYARCQPEGLFSTILLGSLLGFLRACQWLLYRCCKLFS
jgi:menaquinone-9 beta-reductase